MTVFLKKYKWSIFYWTILLCFLLYFTSRQNQYYLDQDIEEFKTRYLIPTLIWAFGLFAIGLFAFWIMKTRTAKQAAISFLSTVLTFAFIIFIFQDIFLGFALFVNRQITKGKIAKTYQASFMTGTEHSKRNFNPYEPATGRIINDKKLVNEFYKPALKQNDHFVLPMK